MHASGSRSRDWLLLSSLFFRLRRVFFSFLGPAEWSFLCVMRKPLYDNLHTSYTSNAVLGIESTCTWRLEQLPTKNFMFDSTDSDICSVQDADDDKRYDFDDYDPKKSSAKEDTPSSDDDESENKATSQLPSRVALDAIALSSRIQIDLETVVMDFVKHFKEETGQSNLSRIGQNTAMSKCSRSHLGPTIVDRHHAGGIEFSCYHIKSTLIITHCFHFEPRCCIGDRVLHFELRGHWSKIR